MLQFIKNHYYLRNLKRVKLSKIESQQSKVDQKLIFQNISCKPLKLSLKTLAKQYKNHFLENVELYESPLLQAKGTLVYTSLFARTIQLYLKSQQLKAKSKLQYFRLIKKSILSGKRFTPESCLNICDYLLDYELEGSEEPIFQKIRSYVSSNQNDFSKKQRQEFNLLYKNLMVEKSAGPIKFVPFQLKKLSQKEIKDKDLKKKLQSFSVKSNFIDNQSKVMLSLFEGEEQKKIKIMIYNQSKMNQENYIKLGNIKKEMKNYESFVFIENPHDFKKIIQNNQLASILLQQPHIDNFRAAIMNGGEKEEIFGSLTTGQLLNNTKLSEVYRVQLSEMHIINFLLSKFSLQQLKEILGYCKFRQFFQDFHDCHDDYYRNKRISIDKINRQRVIDKLEKQQREDLSLMVEEEIYSSLVSQILKKNNKKSALIYIHSSSVSSFIDRLVSNWKREIQRTDKQIEKENLKSQILLEKMGLISSLLKVDFDVDKILQIKRFYNKALYPITHNYL